MSTKRRAFIERYPSIRNAWLPEPPVIRVCLRASRRVAEVASEVPHQIGARSSHPPQRRSTFRRQSKFRARTTRSDTPLVVKTKTQPTLRGADVGLPIQSVRFLRRCRRPGIRLAADPVRCTRRAVIVAENVAASFRRPRLRQQETLRARLLRT